jgi:hypothetical protein
LWCDEAGCFIALLVREPDVARSSERVVGLAAADAALPLRNAAAVGLVDIAVLMLRASAILVLISPILILLLTFS